MTPQQKWVEELTNLSAAPAGADDAILDRAASELEDETPEIKAALTFDMEVLADTRFKKMMQSIGMSASKMTSLTGDADTQKEIDTFHDLPRLKSMSGADVVKAVEAMKKVSTVSEEMRGDLLAMRFGSAGYDPAKRERLEAALEERRKNDKEKTGNGSAAVPDGQPDKEELDKFERDAARIGQEVDETVAEEVWNPLVRQGAMPENLVPDRYSNVKRTFTAASKAYQERLEEYSKGLDENSELLAQLGVGKEVAKRCAEMVKNIAKGIPNAEKVTKCVEVAAELFAIVTTAGATVAEQVIQKQEVVNIIETVMTGVAGACGAALPNPVMAKVISSVMMGSISAERLAQAISDGKPEAFLDSLSGAVNSGLTVAGAATGNPLIQGLTPLVVSTIKNSAQAAAFVAAAKAADEKALQKSLEDLVNSSIGTIGAAVKQAEKDKSGDGDKPVEPSAGMGALVTSAVSDEEKAAAFAGALGATASAGCIATLRPMNVAKSVGAVLKSGLGSAGAGLIQGIKANDAGAVLKVIREVVANSLSTTASIVDSDAEKTRLEDAATQVDAWMGGLGSAGELAKAVEQGEYQDIEQAAKGLFQEVGVYVSNSLKGAAESEQAAAQDREPAPADGVANSLEGEAARGLEAAQLKKMRSQISAAEDVLNDSGSKPEEKIKAAEDLTKAKKELNDQKEMKKELAQDAEQFSLLLNMGVADEDPDDDGAPPPKLKDLILQLQKDRKIFELVKSLTDTASAAGVGAVAQFFPATGAILDFQQFSYQVVKAVQHARQLLEWLDNAGDARSAATVQVHAMLSRVGMEKRQTLEASSRAALKLVAAVGQVVAAGGAHAAPVGVALTAGARVAESGLELLKKVYDEVEMEAGWQIFKKAMADPRDRKNVRAAIQSNPTLAKYTLAWGAMHGGDAVAKEVLRKCGLTDAVLRQKDANVKEVQQYLEEMFNEDLVVLRAVPRKMGWFPADKPAFMLRSWAAFLDAAYNKADPALAPGSGGAVSQAFAEFDQNEQMLKTAKLDYQKARASDSAAPDGYIVNAQSELMRSVKALQAAAQGFSPLDAAGEEHKEMREYLDALIALGEIRLRELAGETVAIERAQAA